jgi:nucleotide-binding universal stress UspA family protein
MRTIPRNILVPTDLSLEADQALSHALYLARLFRADVHLLHVISPTLAAVEPSSFEIELVHERMEAAATRRLDDATSGKKDREVMLHTRVMQGLDVVPAVLAYEARFSVDLIVMGTRGRHGSGRLAWQSHAEEIARTARCPVLTVGRNAFTFPGSISRILIPVMPDGSSNEALATGRLLAGRERAEIDLLHVIPRKSFDTAVNGSSRLAERQITEEVERAYRASSGPDVRRLTHIRYGEPAQTLATFAKERQVQLIIMSTRGAQGIDLALSGSITAQVVGLAPCPVLTLKHNTAMPAIPAFAGHDQVSRLSYT